MSLIKISNLHNFYLHFYGTTSTRVFMLSSFTHEHYLCKVDTFVKQITISVICLIQSIRLYKRTFRRPKFTKLFPKYCHYQEILDFLIFGNHRKCQKYVVNCRKMSVIRCLKCRNVVVRSGGPLFGPPDYYLP